jgi:hypothetical protein
MNESIFDNSLQEFNQSKSNFECLKQRIQKEGVKKNGASYRNYGY